MNIEGPCIILNNTSTIVIDPSWVCSVTKNLNLSITHSKNLKKEKS